MGISVIGGATGGGGGKTLVWKEFLSTSSWTVPADVTQIKAFVCGGGGGGISSTSGSIDAVLGGYGSAEEKILTVTPGTVYTITIGAGGAKLLSGNTGNSGSASSIGALFSVAGGSSGGVADGALWLSYNFMNEIGPQGRGGSGARSGKNTVGSPFAATKGLNGRGGGGGAHFNDFSVPQPMVPGEDGGGIPWLSNSDNTRTLGPDAQANSGAGGASTARQSNTHGNGGSGYVLLTYSTAE
jgi:hypothetical protein